MEAEQSSGVNISDVIEVIETDEMYVGGGGSGADAENRRSRAYVKIIEQPASKALRFRYECEGRSAGSIPGVNSTHDNKTYPGIQIVGHNGKAVVVVSCVTKDAPHRPHPHNLVGKEGCNRGVCTLKMHTDTITFSNLGIQCVKKKDIEEALKVREEIRVDPFRTGFSHKTQPSSIDLNSVRLCFQVFLEGPKKDEYTIPLKPVVSDPIYDKKAMSDLTICKLSDCSATVAGGKEIILLCEKVAKEDIQVRFYEERDGELYWEGQGDFQPTQVHKQVAISFRTPKYKNIEIDKPVNVWMQLRRPSDGAVSESVSFQFIPLDSGRATFWSLHRALAKKGDYNAFSSILSGATSSGQLEGQKRKLESVTAVVVDDFTGVKKPLIERSPVVENKKDSLISGGTLVALPQPQLTVYDNKEPKVIGLDAVKPTDRPLSNVLFGETQNLTPSKAVATKNDFLAESNNNLEGESDKMMEEMAETKDAQGGAFGTVQNPDVDNSQSLNDLITQVAELDEIYSETKGRLVLTREELDGQLEDTAIDCREIFDDGRTYTSLQLAMKNPVDPSEMKSSYEDVIPAKGPIIDVVGRPSTEPKEEKLPPLPPKRAKRTPPRRPDAFPQSKTLPKTPDKRAKQNIFLKLFSKRKKDEASKYSSTTHLENLAPREANRKSSLDDLTNTKDNGEKELSRWFNRGSTGNIPDESLPRGIADSPESPDKADKGGAYLENYTCKDDFDLALDLTEAENYALYTAMAPHATASEFDEMSFYYSPVEGGKILGEEYVKSRRIRDTDSTNLNPAVLKRKRQKYDGESSPKSILRPPQDDDSRSTYVGSLSPERSYHMLQVKREPSEHSPINYTYGGNVSPLYAGTSPGPSSPHNTPSPVPCNAFANFNVFRHNSGGGLLEVKSRGVNPYKQEQQAAYSVAPGTSKQSLDGTASVPFRNVYSLNYTENDLGGAGSYVAQELTGQSSLPCGNIGSTNVRPGCSVGLTSKNENDTSRSHFPADAENTVLNIDSNQYSLELNLGHLDSAELARMAMMTDAHLSENLSNNLTLDEKSSKSEMDCDQQNMTDSFTTAANNALQELVSLGGMNQPSSHQ